MKKFVLLALVILYIQTSCAQKQTAPSDPILIVYLSRTNNTKVVAEIVQEQVGGTLVSLELENPYPDDYDKIVAQVSRENETGFLPPLKTKIDMDSYDTIFLGFPTWGMQMPPPMKSFLNDYDLGSKTVIPFNTHAGYGVGNGFKTVKELCMKSTILPGLSIKGGVERDGVYLAIKGDRAKEVKPEVKKWLEKVGVLH